LKISIGMLAYNESQRISSTLHSVFQQNIFNDDRLKDLEIELIVVPNGCQDDTALVASNTLQELTKSLNKTSLSYRICEITEAGKSNAWNLFIHEFSDPNAEYIFLMDADIELLTPTTLQSMFNALELNLSAFVSVDKLVKDVALKQNKSLMDMLSLSVSKLSGAKSAWICGQLYCGRAKCLRKIWLPKGVLVEDGFIWTMVVTDCFTSPEVPGRVIVADNAAHVFQAYIQIDRLLRHELRQVVGNTINYFVFRDLQKHSDWQSKVGLLIKSRNEQDPLWLDKLVRENVAEKSWWVIPQLLVLRRWQSLRRLPPMKAIVLLPILIMAFIVDLLLCFQANQQLHQWCEK